MLTRWNEIEKMVGAMDLFRSHFDKALWRENTPCYVRGDGYDKTQSLPTNVTDTGDSLVLLAEVPGVKKEDLSININGTSLEIGGSRKNTLPEGFKANRKERMERSFSRRFTLPYEVDADSIEASLNNGILRLILPKSEAARPKQITVH